MRIEEVTKSKLGNAKDKELLILKLRFTQLWDKNFEGNDVAVVGSLDRSTFLKNYRLCLTEMNSRDITKSTSKIDKAVFRKVMTARTFGLDVTDLDDIVVAENFLFIPAEGASIEKALELAKTPVLLTDEAIAKADESYIPLYDLVLKAKAETQIVEVEKEAPKKRKRMWTKKYIEALPDEAFLYIRKGVRYFPYINKDSKIDMGRLESTLPEISKSKLSETVKKKVQKNAEKIIKDVKDELVFERDVSVYLFDKADKDEQVVYGVVYEPDEEDAQGDIANEVEIRKAAYGFMEKVQSFKVMHKGKKVKVKVLESYIAPTEFEMASQTIKKGSWVMAVRVLDKKIWKAIKDGDLTGFSMAGYAKTS